MPVAVLLRKLTDDVLNDNHKWDIPEHVYEASVAPLVKEIHNFGISDSSSVTFDPARHLLFTDDYYEKTVSL
jgi:hypothetical protein